MAYFSRFKLAIKALRQLGPGQVGYYALYQLGLRSGHYQRQLSATLSRLDKLYHSVRIKYIPCLPYLPDRDHLLKLLGDQLKQLYAEADEIVSGNVRLFGGKPVPLILDPPQPLEDWAKVEQANGQLHGQDIKLIWEPGRFGWACKLAMAYHLSNDEQYAESFWFYTERFINSNPPYFGPHWSSAQEVAIRLVALAFALQVFTRSKHSTAERLELVTKAIAIHAERIPPTHVYARSQNNNHLITEALGLYTASAVLPGHPMSRRWHKLGWGWLIYALRTQISMDGTYTQHSTNYHRLMLQAALWAFAIHDHSYPDQLIPSDVTSLLACSTRWLWKLVDPESGRVPNLGHNDGAYILPLTAQPYQDYRPVIHAAAQAFLRMDLTPIGPWADMTSWLCLPVNPSRTEAGLDHWHQALQHEDLHKQSPYILTSLQNGSWGSLRVASFTSRPAHADQLHFDLWWHGLNLAQDPGTYLYNAPPPWENSLTSAWVHNAVVVDGQEPMQRSSRFLYLDWAQAHVLAFQSEPNSGDESLTAVHNGYRKIGVTHTRKVTAGGDGHWEIIDRLDGPPGRIHTASLHWLLPDWPYEIEQPSNKEDNPGYEIRIQSPFGWVTLKTGVLSLPTDKRPLHTINLQLARAGRVLFGPGTVSPIVGWTSPTYGDKIPALACSIEIAQALPIEFKSKWILPSES